MAECALFSPKASPHSCTTRRAPRGATRGGSPRQGAVWNMPAPPRPSRQTRRRQGGAGQGGGFPPCKPLKSCQPMARPAARPFPYPNPPLLASALFRYFLEPSSAMQAKQMERVGSAGADRPNGRQGKPKTHGTAGLGCSSNPPTEISTPYAGPGRAVRPAAAQSWAPEKIYHGSGHEICSLTGRYRCGWRGGWRGGRCLGRCLSRCTRTARRTPRGAAGRGRCHNCCFRGVEQIKEQG